MSALYLIRHATPNRGAGIPYHFPPGPPLNKQGEREAGQIAIFLADKQVTHIYTSPYARALQTANLLAVHLGVTLDIHDGLGEWQASDDEFTVSVRVDALLTRVLAEVAQTSVAIVTHGWIIRTMLKDLGMDIWTLDYYCGIYDTQNPLPCGGIWRVTTDERGSYKFEMVFLP